jgi:hypothetical protein
VESIEAKAYLMAAGLARNPPARAAFTAVKFLKPPALGKN